MTHATLTLAVLLAAPLAWAQHPVPLEETPPPAEEKPKETMKADRRAAELAERYGFEAEEVSALREKGLGWGSVENALGIARKADKPLSEVMALREQGMGWGRIAQSYGFKLGEVRRAKAAGEALRDAPRSPDAGRERERVKEPPGRGRGGAPGRPERPGGGRGERGPKRR